MWNKLMLPARRKPSLPALRAVLTGVALIASGCAIGEGAPFCYGDGLCVRNDGVLILEDGRPYCELTATCGDSDGFGGNGGSAGSGASAGGAGGGNGGNGGSAGSGGTIINCYCPVTATDSDGDCLPNSVEDPDGDGYEPYVDTAGDPNCFDSTDVPGETDPNNPDTDGDGIRDGCEDFNRNGLHDPGLFETYAFHPDSDCDGIPDGLEDANGNGRFDPGETSPLRADTDRDGIPDGVEDLNRDGVVNIAVDLDGDGCIGADDIPGESDPRNADTDGDQIHDGKEDRNRNGFCDPDESCAWSTDSDCDMLGDGLEDLNHDGVVGSNETDPRNPDHDGDGLLDGVEDANRDGRWFADETNPRLYDTDGDSIPDGIEDRNRNGRVDAFDDTVNGNADGCYDEGETAGETDPRLADTDGDGIPDNFEDRDQDGQCAIGDRPDPLNPSQLVRVFLESCAFMADTDCDGLLDGIEDRNQNGIYELGETDARRQDTDLDGLMDGCPQGVDLCEDKDNDGVVDANETNPVSADTDGDGLTDGCERRFGLAAGDTGGPTNPLVVDSDGDGLGDGEEDGNHNCLFEPNVDNCTPPSSCFETDPRTPNPIPQVGTLERVDWEVCSTRNLKRITFAEAARESLDYRLALEVERFDTTKTCGSPSDCASNEICNNQKCARESVYFVDAFGQDNDGDGFSINDNGDHVIGHVFQSSRGVIPDAGGVGGLANRNIYGFVQVKDDGSSLATIMQNLRAQLVALPSRDADVSEVEQIGDQAPVAAHDSLPSAQYPNAGTYPISYAQGIFRLRTTEKQATNVVRNKLLRDSTFVGPIQLDPANVPPAQDLVYGNINCATDPYCYRTFTVYVSAVQRLNQDNRLGGTGSVVFTVALTEDDRCGPAPLPSCATPGQATTSNRLYEERKARLEDLTGGSALARYTADTSKVCDQRNQQMAVADVLWVVDDSGSMQQTITRLQQASRDAQAVLTANSGIVDFRVAMTTTNPSSSARTRCDDGCTESCGGGTGCEVPRECDPHLGCIKMCPTGCSTTCGGGSCGGACAGSCLQNDFATLQAALDLDADGGGDIGDGDYFLPGGGGTFYSEDTYYLDCDDDEVIGDCSSTPGFSAFFSGGTTFNGVPRVRLSGNAGFISSDPTASCSTAQMSLEAVPVSCLPNDPNCCRRLTEECTDGPTVLASQMCDLIRAMGGIPEVNPNLSGNASGRPHSGPELGSRQARRLVERMLPALPADYESTCGGSCTFIAKDHLRLTCLSAEDVNCQPCDPRTDAYCPLVPLVTIFLSDEEDFLFKDDCASSANDADRRQLPSDCRLLDGDPSTLESCDPCQRRSSCDDDGDCLAPATCNNGVCSCEACEQVSVCDSDDDCPGACISGRCACAADNDCNPGSSCIAGACGCDRGAYCEDPSKAYALAPPTGYNPDAAGHATSDIHSLLWRSPTAPQCEAGAVAAPPADCPTPPATLDDLRANPQWFLAGPNCAQWAQELQDAANVNCSANPCADQTSERACKALNIDVGGGPEPYCAWVGGECLNRCEAYTKTVKATVFAEGDAQHCACDGDPSVPGCTGGGDPLCRWERANVNWLSPDTVWDACQPKYDLGDCRACKRFTRTLEAVSGNTGDPWLNGGGNPLVGFGQLGRVNAIVRNAGEQGFGGYPVSSNAPRDECGGSSATWGLGDGQAYRDIAILTGGRFQNVCSDSYADFLRLVIQDIAALSAPYPLSGRPIASTIKVGIARPNGSGGYEYIAVPRSSTQGFFYDATQNTIAFKSDPVDGVCAPGAGCTVNPNSLTFEASEIEWARTKPEVPRESDLLYISYRTWLSVPCQERCADDEVCLRVLCVENPNPPACPGGLHSECPLGYLCNTSTNTCQINCTPGETTDACVPNDQCGLCQTFNTNTSACEPVGSLCDCNPSGAQTCLPGVAGSCPKGFTCDENCGCTPIPGCPGGFTGDPSFAQCQIDRGCCELWQQAGDLCRAGICDDNSQPCLTSTDCNAGATCLGRCNNSGATCANDAACNNNATCNNRQCTDNANPCVSNADCTPGVQCRGACSDDASSCTNDVECNLARCVGAMDQNACEAQPGQVCELLNLAYQPTCVSDGSPCPTGTECGPGDTCDNPLTCAGNGSPCLTNGDCGGNGPCLSPCDVAAPCEYTALTGCTFSFPTCCSGGETVGCFHNQETGEGSLFCRSECVCNPQCRDSEICEENAQLGGCLCAHKGP